MVLVLLVLDAIVEVPLYTALYFLLPAGWLFSLTTATPLTSATPVFTVWLPRMIVSVPPGLETPGTPTVIVSLTRCAFGDVPVSELVEPYLIVAVGAENAVPVSEPYQAVTRT